MRRFWLALGFLTVLPTPSTSFEAEGWGQTGLYFPLVGLVIGGIVAGGHWLLGQWFPPTVTAVLTLILWVVVTGGLHLDGLADCGDALFASVTPERRLEILRDPRLGAFGGMGLVLFLMAKGTAVFSLSYPTLPLLLAPVLARWCVLWIARQPSARTNGLGRSFAEGLSGRIIWGAAVLPAVLVLFAGWRGWGTAVAALLLIWFISRLARHRLEGVTGDVLGLTIEWVELVVLLGFISTQ